MSATGMSAPNKKKLNGSLGEALTLDLPDATLGPKG